MNSKMTINNYQQTTKTTTKQTTRTGTEPQKWRSHEGLSIGVWVGERGGKGTENK